MKKHMTIDTSYFYFNINFYNKNNILFPCQSNENHNHNNILSFFHLNKLLLHLFLYTNFFDPQT